MKLHTFPVVQLYTVSCQLYAVMLYFQYLLDGRVEVVPVLLDGRVEVVPRAGLDLVLKRNVFED
jgi:hypothetical protein